MLNSPPRRKRRFDCKPAMPESLKNRSGSPHEIAPQLLSVGASGMSDLNSLPGSVEGIGVGWVEQSETHHLTLTEY
jgi:hypothetical protein